MKKKFHIDIFVNYRPEERPTGFHDFLRLSVEGRTLFSSMCSASPNGYHPRTKQPWYKHYGWVAPQTTSIELVLGHKKFGDCILVAGGKEIISINDNPNHNDRKVISSVFIHRALGVWNKLWRGSAGCFTLNKEQIKLLIRAIKSAGVGSIGVITIHHNGNLT